MFIFIININHIIIHVIIIIIIIIDIIDIITIMININIINYYYCSGTVDEKRTEVGHDRTIRTLNRNYLRLHSKTWQPC